jgi:hypothetical protein
MNLWKSTTLFLVICFVAVGCRAFQPTPKPQAGGGMLAIIPPIQMPQSVQLVGVTNAPVQIRLVAPENSDLPTISTWTRKVTDAGVDEQLVTELGINQHDKARDDWATVRKLEARMKSYGPIRVFGFVLILAALAMFHPVVRAITGTTGQIATGATGLLLVFGAQLVQGNETLILVGSTVGLALYLFARRHGLLQGLVDASPKKP